MSDCNEGGGDAGDNPSTTAVDSKDGAAIVRRPRADGSSLPTVIRSSPALVELLERHHEAIKTDWARALHDVSQGQYSRLPIEDLEVWTSKGLSAVIGSLRTGSPAPIEAHARAVSRVRRLLGFDIGEVSAGLLHLKRIVFPLIIREFGEPGVVEDLVCRLDICVCLLASRFAKLYAEGSRRSLERERSRTALLLESVEAAVGSLDPDRVLHRVAEVLGRAIEASSCAVLWAGDFPGQFRLIVAPMDIEGSSLGNLLERPVDAATDPLIGDVLSSREPVRYQRGDGRPMFGRTECSELGIGASLAIPIIVANNVLAIALAISVEDRAAFGARRRKLAQGIASAVAPAVDHARLYAESRRNLAESRMRQRLTSALLSGVGVSKVLELACRESRDLLGAQGAAILLRSEDGQRLEIAHAEGEAAEDAERLLERLECANEPTIPVEPILLDDLLAGELATPSWADVSSVLIVPLRVHWRTIGALQVVNKDGGFDDADRRTAGIVSEQIAVAIEHARLHDQQERVAVLEERQRLARDLHDSVTQSIYGITTFAEASVRLLDAGDTPGATSHLKELCAAAQNALREMRLLIFELHPVDLEREGLVSVLRSRLAAVEGRAGLQTELRCEGVHDLPRDVEDGLFRIAQEALNNSLKHANASRILLTLEQTDTGVCLVFSDDGVGFDLRAGRLKGGLGLRGIEGRVLQMNGRISINTGPGEGTRITVDLPLTPRGHEPNSRNSASEGASN